MSLAIWILIGIFAGFVAGKLGHHRLEGLGFDIFMGVGGSLMGGLLMTFIGMAGTTGLNMACIIVSIISAIIWLLGFNLANATDGALTSKVSNHF